MRTVWDEGATADVRVQVPDAGPNTTVEVAVWGSDGAERTTTAPRPNDDRTEWDVPVMLDAAGVWTVVATVTGAGAGVRRYRLRVRPAVPVEHDGRVYATSADWARLVDDAPPADADRQLARASEVVDALVFSSVYPVDADGYPTTSRVRDAFRSATIAQAAFMAAGRGSEHGTSGQYSQVAIGSVNLSGRNETQADGAATPEGVPVAPSAVSALRGAGLLPGTVWTRG